MPVFLMGRREDDVFHDLNAEIDELRKNVETGNVRVTELESANKALGSELRQAETSASYWRKSSEEHLERNEELRIEYEKLVAQMQKVGDHLGTDQMAKILEE